MSALGVSVGVMQTREHPRFVIFKRPNYSKVAINPSMVDSVAVAAELDGEPTCSICTPSDDYRVFGDLKTVTARLTVAE